MIVFPTFADYHLITHTNLFSGAFFPLSTVVSLLYNLSNNDGDDDDDDDDDDNEGALFSRGYQG